jgi:signal transduction histidine kinase
MEDHPRSAEDRWRLPALAADVALALVVTGLLVLASAYEVRHWPGASVLDAPALTLLGGAGLVLSFRRVFPLAAYSASLGFVLAFILAGHPPGPIYVAPLIGLLTLVIAARTMLWIPAGLAGALLLAVAHVETGGTGLSALLWGTAWLLLAVLFAVWIHVRRRFAAEARARAEWAGRTRHEEERRRAAEERLGIAREVHDVVGHSLAVISLQAGVAEHLLDSRPEEVRRAIRAIRQVSRQALSELGAELALLRGDDMADQRRPPPDLDALADLVGSMRQAGLAVNLESDVGRALVPEVVSVAAYRIVQEALTNVARHAGTGAHASVRIGAAAESLEVEVLDDGRGAAEGLPPGSGLTGMKERAAALGGELVAGTRPEGGFRVYAVLPRGGPA